MKVVFPEAKEEMAAASAKEASEVGKQIDDTLP